MYIYSTCVNPDPTRDSRWRADRITDWPVNICISCVTFKNTSFHFLDMFRLTNTSN